MHKPINELRALQMRIHDGDRSAVEQFRQDFFPAIRRIIRRATSTNRDNSSVSCAIRNLAEQFDMAGSFVSDSHGAQTLDRLASRLCDLLVARLESVSRPNTAAIQTFTRNAAVATQA